jgi:hypothetical protein
MDLWIKYNRSPWQENHIQRMLSFWNFYYTYFKLVFFLSPEFKEFLAIQFRQSIWIIGKKYSPLGIVNKDLALFTSQTFKKYNMF